MLFISGKRIGRSSCGIVIALQKTAKRAKELETMFAELKGGVVVVEGRHDVLALSSLGVCSCTYDYAVRNAGRLVGEAAVSGTKLFLLMDDDKGGADKLAKMLSAIDAVSQQANATVDVMLGLRMLRLLGVKSVEQIRAPAAELLMKK
ncbi:MAG: hypothetical protein ACP5T3_01395 [Candidatus Micrarchaeia archaeon]